MRDPIYTKDLLQDYREAALSNASSLLSEAKLLLENEHYARAYFLSIAAIEEIGKSTILYYAEGRNLNASDVQSRIRIDTQNHSSKITNAFIASLKCLNQKKLRESLTKILGYAVDLKAGREPAMYSDVGSDMTVKIPNNLVRSSAAKDCLRLAVICFEETQSMINSKASPTTSSDQDKFWALGKKAHQVWKKQDFGEFLVDYIEKNGCQEDYISPVTTKYYDEYLSRGKKYKS